MDAAVTVLFLGLLIFTGNILSRLFTLTKIPDVLFLIAIGIVIGPLLGLVSPGNSGSSARSLRRLRSRSSSSRAACTSPLRP